MNTIIRKRLTQTENWILILFVVCGVSCSTIGKKQPTAEDLPPWSTVIRLYQLEWDDSQSAFINRDETSRTFSSPLSNLIHAAANRNFVGKLNFDPLYHVKSSEIKNLKISRPVTIAADQSSIDVTFFSLNEPVKIQVDAILLRTGEWKIANIRYPDNSDLISVLLK